ncbi:YigZ family protein [Proteiniclasticum sp. C24MP]|uniref:YigZ family protein n=1 Tax=Proteiniclasticum sp. C24MP TaxID=3374101 RepID=UPI003754E4E5
MGYRTVGNAVEREFTEKKSVFIGIAKRVFTEEEAKQFISEIKSRYKDARHHVYAYTIEEDMHIQRYSDDGEPHGTGGIPILDVIRKNDLRNVCVVVVRYFGGILLGAGGLTRAYVKGAADAIEAAGVVERVSGHQIDLILEYDLFGKLQYFLKENQIDIKDTQYTDKVKASVFVETIQKEQIVQEMMNLTAGKVEIEILEEELFYKRGKKLLKEFEE